MNRIVIFCLTLLALLGYLASITHAAAGCQMPSIVDTLTVLSPSECSEYIQTTNVIVREDATLQIEAGTIIKVDGLYIITVDGELIARGTTQNPVQFTSNQASPAAGDWAHILFESTSINATFDENGNYEAGSILQHAIVEYGGGISSGSSNGVIIADNAGPFIDNILIRHNKETAIRVRGGFLFSGEDIKITNNDITENGSGSCVIDVDNNAQSIVSDNSVHRNNGSGICVAFGNSRVNRNTIQENDGWGIALGLSDSIVSGNVVISNTDGGISHRDAYGYISHNTIRGNQGTDGAGLRITSFGADARSVFIHSNTILSNTASNSGGGLFLGCTLYPYDIRENIIRGNQVLNKNGTGGGVTLIVPCDEARFLFNDIYDNQATFGSDLYNGLSSIYSDVDARGNYWGTTNESDIEEGIYHQVDSTARGFVDYSNYLSEPISELSHLYLPVVQNGKAP